MAGVEEQEFFNIKKRVDEYYLGHILQIEKYSLLRSIFSGKPINKNYQRYIIDK